MIRIVYLVYWENSIKTHESQRMQITSLCPLWLAGWKNFALHDTEPCSWLISDLHVDQVICIPLHGVFQQSQRVVHRGGFPLKHVVWYRPQITSAVEPVSEVVNKAVELSWGWSQVHVQVWRRHFRAANSFFYFTTFRYKIMILCNQERVYSESMVLILSLAHIVLFPPPPFYLAWTSVCSTAAVLWKDMGGKKRRKEEGNFTCQTRGQTQNQK